MDNYVVISEERVIKLLNMAGYEKWYIDEYMAANTIPAQELWDAAQKDMLPMELFNGITQITLTDFLTSQNK